MDSARSRILLIEDDELIGRHLKLLLDGEGYDVTLRENGRLALDFLNQAEPLPTLIFLDLMMPVMNGLEFRRKQLADSRLAKIPVVVMTADAHVEERKAEMKPDVFLKKPLELTDVLELAGRFCGRS